MRILAIEHVQLAMPAGEEDAARAFYTGVLGLREVAKPETLAARGGAWFESGAVRVHLGIDPDFVAAGKAHPAFVVDDLDAALAACAASGRPPETAIPIDGYRRAYVRDPFGNRIELMEERAANGEERTANGEQRTA